MIVAGVGRDDVVDHAQRRRLAGAVGAEDAVDHAARDLERHAVDRDVVAEPLDDAVDATSACASARSPRHGRATGALEHRHADRDAPADLLRGSPRAAPSATCGDTSTPRLIGPGCMTIASGFAYASVRSDSPNVRDSSRVFGNRGASPSNRSCWTRSIITTSAPSSPSSSRVHDAHALARQVAADQLDAARDQRPRRDQPDPRAELGQAQHVRARDARVRDVADDRDLEARRRLPLCAADRRGVEQRLRRVLVLAVARVDDRAARRSSRASPRRRRTSGARRSRRGASPRGCAPVSSSVSPLVVDDDDAAMLIASARQPLRRELERRARARRALEEHD